jgi:hypothetical protein
VLAALALAASWLAAAGCGTSQSVGMTDDGGSSSGSSGAPGDAQGAIADATLDGSRVDAEGGAGRGNDGAAVDAQGIDSPAENDPDADAGSADAAGDVRGDSAPDAGTPASDGGDGGDGGRLRCDDAGNCSCLRIASIGHDGVWGPCSSDSPAALQTWLNAQSTALVDTYDTTKPTLTPDFLAQYDVVVLQWMVAKGQQGNDGAPWSFSPDEVSALADWVNGGGGIVALSGYQGTDPIAIEDIYASNQLLSFTDIQFDKDVLVSTPPSPSYCWGGTAVLGGPIGDAGVMTIGTWDMTTPIGAHVTSIGALDVRSVTATTATTDCTDGTYKYAVHEPIGRGHVVAYGDEWITYAGQWTGTSTCLGDGGLHSNPSDPCYQRSASQIFQIPQLWYNAIKYASGGASCFSILSPAIVP